MIRSELNRSVHVFSRLVQFGCRRSLCTICSTTNSYSRTAISRQLSLLALTQSATVLERRSAYRSHRLKSLRPRTRSHSASDMSTSQNLTFEVVDIENPRELNFILGHSHFIKTVEDIYEALVQSGVGLKFGVAFCEASEGHPAMPGRRVRFDGNDDQLIELAKVNAMKIGAGHSFIVFIDNGFPVNVLNAIKAVPEVCRIYCATANPTSVIIAKTSDEKKGIMGVIDGVCPVAFESEEDRKARTEFLRTIGYKR